MRTLTLFLLSYIITSPLHAMDNAAQSQDSWLRCPEQIRTTIYETIRGNKEEIIKRDLISIPEYQASECRSAYSTKLLDLYKTHNPTSMHYENAKKWVLADAVMYSLINSNAHQVLTDHPIAFGKDNPADKELLWNVVAVAIMRNYEELKQQATALMTHNQIPLPDSNFMTYLLSYAIITHSSPSLLNTCVTMGAKPEGIKTDSPSTPWIVGNAKESEPRRLFNNHGKTNYAWPLDCAIRASNQDALKWLKEKQPGVLTDQVWIHYLREYAKPYGRLHSDRYKLELLRFYSIRAILTVNPDLKIDQETADMIYNNCDDFGIRVRMYQKTSWGYHLGSALKSLVGISHEPITHTTSARQQADNASRTISGDDAV